MATNKRQKGQKRGEQRKAANDAMMVALREIAASFANFLSTVSTGSQPGHCFENALRFIMEKPSYDGTPVLLCHGLVRSPKTGRFHAHAWLEWGDGGSLVLEPSNGKPFVSLFLRPAYYRMSGAKRIRRYTAKQARTMAINHRTCGPWPDPADD